MTHCWTRSIANGCGVLALAASTTLAAAGIGDVFGALSGGGSSSVTANELVADQSGQRNTQNIEIGTTTGRGHSTVVIGSMVVRQQGNGNGQAVNIGTVRGSANVNVYLREGYISQQGSGLTQSVNVGNQF